MIKRIKINLLNILLVCLLLLGGYALYMAMAEQQDYDDTAAANTSDYDYNEIQDLVTIPEPAPSQDQQNDQEQEYVPAYNTEEMLALNKDFKGWLWIPDTYVNYPVVQAEDNNYYLRRTFQGKYSLYGSLFLDEDSLYGSTNRVIHGHNMGNGRTEMFSCLVNYQDPTWARENRYAYFTEPSAMQDNKYELFAVLNFNINDLDEFNYFQTDFETEEDFHAFVDYLIDKSLYHTDFYPQRDTLIFSTCNRPMGGEDNRLLVCFGRINANETETNTFEP